MNPARRYARASRRAFGEVLFYREQWAAAGAVLAEPTPTATADLPQPPHTLCPFARPWSPAREPSLWTPTGRPLARALRLAGCDPRRAVLEICPALRDSDRLPRAGFALARARYGVLLGPSAVVASAAHRLALNRAALASVTGPAWLVGTAGELADVTEWAAGDDAAGRPLHPVVRLAPGDPVPPTGPVLLHDPHLGYLGARRRDCAELHLDHARVDAREHSGRVAFSLPGRRRPTLLALLPPGAARVVLTTCPRHGGPVLRPR